MSTVPVPLQAMEGSMLTLSLANWMELPGLKLKDWMRDKRRSDSHQTRFLFVSSHGTFG